MISNFCQTGLENSIALRATDAQYPSQIGAVVSGNDLFEGFLPGSVCSCETRVPWKATQDNLAWNVIVNKVLPMAIHQYQAI